MQKVEYIQQRLDGNEICCLDWRELFKGANHADQIALLPILMKKIPTFDFALIFAEGVDHVKMRDNEVYTTMRDNVVFELGLCLMALGSKRVILLSEEGIRLPDDLSGIERIGLRHITYSSEKEFSQTVSQLAGLINERAAHFEQPLATQIDRVIAHITSNADSISPVFVGAAVSSAEAYFTNFIVRLLEHINDPIFRKDSKEPLALSEEPQVYVIFPASADSMTHAAIAAYYQKLGAESFFIENAGARSLSFRGMLRNGQLTILDMPTSVTASYSVVHSILNINSDDAYDPTAEERFITKEMDIYAYTLKKLFSPEIAQKRLAHITDQATKDRIIQSLGKGKVRLLREDFQDF